MLSRIIKNTFCAEKHATFLLLNEKSMVKYLKSNKDFHNFNNNENYDLPQIEFTF